MRHVLLAILLSCMLAGQASAGLYTLDVAAASGFQQVSISSGDRGYLSLVIDKDETIYWEDVITSPGVYPEAMQGQVGFVGTLTDYDRNQLASMQIGGGITSGEYTGFRAFIANDNQSTWQYQLYASSGTATARSGWTTLVADTSAWLEFLFPTAMTVTQVGFVIRADYSLPDAPSRTDTFHTSVVPLHGAVILGMLGLGAAGMKLRKFV